MNSYTLLTMIKALFSHLEQDCQLHGLGRKKWWAHQLGIPPLTFSHWLAGRQQPNGEHTLHIKALLDQIEKDKALQGWKDLLWDSYYSHQIIPDKIFPMILFEVLSMSSLDSRTLALLSRYIEKGDPLQFPSTFPKQLINRIGWLLEVSGLKAPFLPDKSLKIDYLLQHSEGPSGLNQHIRHFRTSTGKRWKLYDCPLDPLKDSLP